MMHSGKLYSSTRRRPSQLVHKPNMIC